MSDQYDGFGDVIEASQGIFSGSDGLQAYDSVRHTATPEGLLVECHCANCGYPRHVTIAYPELIALKYNVSPHEAFNGTQFQQLASQWATTNQQRGVKYAWYPATLRCRCGQPFMRPLVSPGEIDGLLAPGRQRGYIQPQQEEQLTRHCFQIGRRLGRV